ncbi:MAG: hypothetical protein K0R25_495 [Rickettsiaceae bacterium]|jgi:cell pole-organizing protein PopZ|nr:hypothetical protein [Rickettsiaceae bacterium]
MKKHQGTTSILESIRNKLKKIEKTHSQPDPEDEMVESEDFEYIDDSKSAVESKINSVANNDLGFQRHDTQQEGDDDFNFLNSDDDHEEHEEATPQILAPATESKIETPQKSETVDLAQKPKTDDLDFMGEDMKISKDDDLDLEQELEEHNEEPEIKNEPSFASLKTEENLQVAKDEDLNLENLEDNHAEGPVEIKTANDLDLDSPKLEIEEETDLEEDEIDFDDLDNLKVDDEEEDEEEYEEEDEAEHEEDYEEQLAAKEEQPIAKNDDLDLDNLGSDNYVEQSKPITKGEDFDDLQFSQPLAETNTNIAPDDFMKNTENKSIISEESARKSIESIKNLIQVIPQNLKNHQPLQSPAFKSGQTIEDLVAEILTPKLEQWLNENLPTIVERIVREEIKNLIPKN